ncbi:hypothetical protein SCHPADRAFT_924689 [Schizopora paradoxa]|uniref:Uncharacterized protein n=1 Tax=Schizopora paradoxa TaxID=27342 RepID=A0A0H2SBD6_9AGAM|nr:hypothetical protein SCHPADRAFT_924689 [Schizopora paradoxa]
MPRKRRVKRKTEKTGYVVEAATTNGDRPPTSTTLLYYLSSSFKPEGLNENGVQIHILTYYGFVYSLKDFDELAKRILDVQDPRRKVFKIVPPDSLCVVHGYLKFGDSELMDADAYYIKDAWVLNSEESSGLGSEATKETKETPRRRIIFIERKHTENKLGPEFDVLERNLENAIKWFGRYGYTADMLTQRKVAVPGEEIHLGEPSAKYLSEQACDPKLEQSVIENIFETPRRVEYAEYIGILPFDNTNWKAITLSATSINLTLKFARPTSHCFSSTQV